MGGVFVLFLFFGPIVLPVLGLLGWLEHAFTVVIVGVLLLVLLAPLLEVRTARSPRTRVSSR